MADTGAMWFRVVLLIGLLCGPTAARAHEWVDYFATDDATLSPGGYGMARDVARYWRMDPDRSVVVIDSHLDTEEASRPERRTDLWRARALILELVRQGVPLHRISIRLHAADQLARPSRTVEPLNRRVVINVNRGTGRSVSGVRAPHLIVDRFGPTLRFGPGETDLSPDDRFLLESSVVAPGMENLRARVEAHADTVGTFDENLALTQARAESVARELVRIGLPWDRIELMALGETQLAVPSADRVSEAGNRRVMVHLTWPAEAAR